jgi:hypothetical protein
MPSAFDVMFGPEPEEKPKPGPGKPGLFRPSFVKRTTRNVEQWFDIAELWSYVKEEIKNIPEGTRVDIPVAQITNPGLSEEKAARETAQFFAMMPAISGMDARRAWDTVLGPFLDEVEEALNAKRPKELTGKLKFDVAPDSSVMLFYVER